MLAARSRSPDTSGEDWDLSALRKVGLEMKCREWIRFEGHGVRIVCQKTATHEILHAARVKVITPGVVKAEIEVSMYWQTEPKVEEDFE